MNQTQNDPTIAKINGRIVLVKLSEITPYWRNPRENDEAVKTVTESIEEFGYNVPMVLGPDKVIITGHTRYKSLRRKGVEEVECIISNMTPEQAQGFRVMDNKSSELATWNMSNLIPELRAYMNLTKFTVHFPDFKLETIEPKTFQAKYEPVTSDEVAKTQQSLSERFSGIAADRRQTIRSYTCPKCDHTFDTAS